MPSPNFWDSEAESAFSAASFAACSFASLFALVDQLFELHSRVGGHLAEAT